ncbi:hypothetical protein TrLO_g15453 [Triparma laevis f. longispina]|uniref:Uncharacterized protein n=1 Tax=Triparma laevis f. longispina TaxID=1714387 RepID=A0A9W7F8B9_9STRA|nr:hypothetical protein TrLO_g15453 [Triparma laevis f. longispina]
MTTAKREKMLGEDDVKVVDDVEIKIEFEREEGEMFERKEEDRREGERTGFEEIRMQRFLGLLMSMGYTGTASRPRQVLALVTERRKQSVNISVKLTLRSTKS